MPVRLSPAWVLHLKVMERATKALYLTSHNNKKMKKKVLAAVVAIAAVAVINMDLVSSRKQEALSAIHLANIEALAQGESGGGGGGNCSKQCLSHPEYICITQYGLIARYKCAD